jgi:hypothetical protein
MIEVPAPVAHGPIRTLTHPQRCCGAASQTRLSLQLQSLRWPISQTADKATAPRTIWDGFSLSLHDCQLKRTWDCFRDLPRLNLMGSIVFSSLALMTSRLKPPPSELVKLERLFRKGRMRDVIMRTQRLLKKYPESQALRNTIGSALAATFNPWTWRTSVGAVSQVSD